MTWPAWPKTASELMDLQSWLGGEAPSPWAPGGDFTLASCFVCFERGEAGPGRPGDEGWAGAALWRAGDVLTTTVVSGTADAGYEAGLLALREGRLLAAAIEALDATPDALLVNGTGRDHPRRAGLAVHLGWALHVPSVGVTHRPMLAAGKEPGAEAGSREPLLLGDEIVGYRLRTKRSSLPLAVHAGWRTDAGTAVDLVLVSLGSSRTPEPLRAARQAARTARSAASA